MATKKTNAKKASAKKKPAAKKATAKKVIAKKVIAKKATAKKATAKKAGSVKSSVKKTATKGSLTLRKLTALPVKKDPGLVSLLSKIQIELDNGKKQSLSPRDIARAQECLNTSGRILLSFRKVIFNDGTGTGTGGGTQLID